MALLVSKPILSSSDVCGNGTHNEDDLINGNTIFRERCANWVLTTITIM